MADSAIEQFVREVLGCHCPGEMLRSVSVEAYPRAFADLDLPAAQLLRIGGRLLVLLLVARARDAPGLPLAELFARGRRLRAAESCNRFRLVIATPDAEAIQEPLAEWFASFNARDERLHLHVVAADRLPQVLQPRQPPWALP